MLDRAVLAGRVHGLQDDQQRVGVLGVQLVLELGQQLNALGSVSWASFFFIYSPL